MTKQIPAQIRSKVSWHYHNYCRFLLFICGFWINVTKKDVDYTEYLGQNYVTPNFSTIISNHTSAFDPIILAFLYNVRMVSKASLRSVPIIGWAGELLETIFVDRGSDHQSKEKIISQIEKAQQEFYDHKTFKPLGIFPEGTTTNGKVLLKFKHGAFISKLPVKPHIITLKSWYFNPSYDCVSFAEWFIFLLLQFRIDVEVIEMPTFGPNEELWKRTDLGSHKDEIYAEAVRWVMAKVGNL